MLRTARGFGPATQLNHQLTIPAHPLVMTFWRSCSLLVMTFCGRIEPSLIPPAAALNLGPSGRRPPRQCRGPSPMLPNRPSYPDHDAKRAVAMTLRWHCGMARPRRHPRVPRAAGPSCAWGGPIRFRSRPALRSPRPERAPAALLDSWWAIECGDSALRSFRRHRSLVWRDRSLLRPSRRQQTWWQIRAPREGRPPRFSFHLGAWLSRATGPARAQKHR